jgi:hypothetical protein
MRLKSLNLLSVIPLLVLFVQFSEGQTITGNKTGQQGGYWYEYWKDGGTGTMVLGDGCNFTCEWGSVNNILFRKGVRPGSKKQIITYTADYKPTGNSYLSIYGWFKNPLVEYYIIESYGTYKPGGGSKGTVVTDSGTYTIHQNSRTGASIEGNKTFQQYWSIRQTKRTSGVITFGNHFDAWEKLGMTIGSFYEVSFNVEAYQSGGGSADVKVVMDTVPKNTNILDRFASEAPVSVAQPARNQGHFAVTEGKTRPITFMVPVNSHASLKVYNYRGQEIARLAGRDYSAGQHSATLNTSDLAQGVYYWTLK